MNYVDPAFVVTPSSGDIFADLDVDPPNEKLRAFYARGKTLLAADKPTDAAPVVDWSKLWGSWNTQAPEPPKPVDPRSEALGRALAADKPLDGYGRKA